MWFTSYYLRSNEVSQESKISCYALFKNVKDRLRQSLALAYILYLYKLHQLYILKEDLCYGTLED